MRCCRFLDSMCSAAPGAISPSKLEDWLLLRDVQVDYREHKGPGARHREVLFTRDYRRLKVMKDAGQTTLWY